MSYRAPASIWILFALLLPYPLLRAQSSEEALLREFRWRSIGPANMSGRIVDLEALDSDYRNVIVASASGGVWKSVNAGTTWKPIFDGTGVASIGDVAIFQKDPNILWVGTGEANNRNSVAWGDGIFKSTDGGRSWVKLTRGLPAGDTGRIGLAVYRSNPKIVMAIVEHGVQLRPNDKDYNNMSVLGSGIYRSEDAGNTWKYLNRFNNRPFYYSQIRINPLDDQRVYVLTTRFMESSDGGILVEITDLEGKRRKSLTVDGRAGINRLRWNLRFDLTEAERTQAAQQRSPFERRAAGEDVEFAGAFAPGPQGALAPPGEYLVKLTVGGKTYSGKVVIRRDPLLER